MASTIRMSLFHNMAKVPESLRSRYEMYHCTLGDRALIPTLKATLNPPTILLYTIAAAANSAWWAREQPNDPIGYFWIEANRPDWFLRDTDGLRINYDNYPDVWALDPGNEDYQDSWAANAITRAQSLGVDGVKLDNVNTRWDWNHAAVPAKYPAQRHWYLAMGSFLQNVVPQLQRAGMSVIGNGSGDQWTSGPWTEWIKLLDGREYERGPSFEDEAKWRDILAGYQKHPNKIYVHYLIDPATYPEVFRFKLASFLLFAGPNSYLSMPWTETPPITDPLTEVDLGRPAGKCRQIAPTVYQRTYSKGEVVLNISASVPAIITPGVKTIDGKPLSPSRLLLAPRESLILAGGRRLFVGA